MKQKKIQAYLLRVNKLSGVVYKGYLAEVDNTLEAEQRYVNFNEANGLIAVVSINNDIDIICNDEGKIVSETIGVRAKEKADSRLRKSTLSFELQTDFFVLN